MLAIKRNIWALFFLILSGGVALLGFNLYSRWQTVLSDHESYQKARAKLVAQSVDSVLRTQELVLDVVGRELLRQEDIWSRSRRIPLLDSILRADPSLIGFGLARPNGKLVRVSSNLDLSILPNLRTHPETREGFAQALESDSMVLGRTYFMDALGSWVIPIRKALRSPEGDVVAVMTAGLQIGSGPTVFDQTLHDGPDDAVILFREADGYVQFMSQEGVGPEQFSEIRIPEDRKLSNRRSFEKQLNMPFEDVFASKEAVSVRMQRDGHDVLMAGVFNKRYQLWVLSETKMAPVHREFARSFLGYFLAYVAVSSVLFLLFRVIDRTERKRHQQLMFQSRHDDLTGLLNRAGLMDRVEYLISKDRPFGLVVVNIDNFRGINDRFGEEYGDKTLQQFSQRLWQMLESSDDLARLGGDEFAVLTRNVDLQALEKACISLVHQMADTVEVERLQLQVTASVGVVIYPDHGDSFSDLIRGAHLAVYEAKKNRNSACVYLKEMEMAYLRRLTIEQRLRYGLALEAPYMVYQPQVDEKGQTVALESLVRWQDEELGFVSPAEFVAVAEQSGLMVPLGHYVLKRSIREFSELRSDLGDHLDLAVNISVIQFTQPDFVDSVLSVLAKHGVPPRHLVLEITETLFMYNFARVLNTLERLRAEGIRVSMDDFGTGYSSLSLLRQLPIDELKIDKSFVDHILDDEKARNMIESIIAIARNHNMELIAEGVELEDQVNALLHMGCRRFQGYYFSKPQSMAQIRDALSAEVI
ncbi:EAL domain-containing protein [Marinobacter sediminum]|uniref:putative bifunctional diguanylate cyclase/phosphodiesterase n=1 Tax=Marinobacter sediminum TaxID=256323 RepID=UPI00202F0129|nr:EAL domain-containing protein [Marinobacter sediminum]